MDNDIKAWIEKLRTGDPRSQQEIWNSYFSQLVALARSKLIGERKREYDEEDVAVMAFNSFFEAIEKGQFPDLDDEDDIWKLLVTITAHKAADYRRKARAEKRGGGFVRGESVFMNPYLTKQYGIDQYLGKEPTPEIANQFLEEFERLIAKLKPELKEVAILKMEGYSQVEIAKKLNCAESTVTRRLKLISESWENQTDELQ